MTQKRTKGWKIQPHEAKYSTTNAVMLGTLPIECALRSWQRTQHHRFPFASVVATVRGHGGIPPRPGDTLPPARGSATSSSAAVRRFPFASDIALVSVNG